ncbi:MAG: STAS domain-containing protein [Zoogloeaceae bacterium]|jgi:phospholipid transport system transporter-binding protein|nr:STAS domain-containing protein [Zoogloeaceae bacterium]
MIRRDADGCLRVEAPMTLANARPLLATGEAALQTALRAGGKKCALEFSGVAGVDSSGLAVLLAWQRFCRARDARLCLAGAPENLRALADLYGLSPLFEWT